MFKAGEILEDTSIYQTKHGSHVFATLIEDTDAVDLDNGVTIQEHDKQCPQCGATISAHIMTKSCVTGKVVMCYYCTDCPLLFRTILVGSMGWDGNYFPNKDYE